MIYLDNAATTKIEEPAFNAMLPFLKEEYGNASAVYELARRSKKAIFEARKNAASLIGAMPSEIFFTSGGTESDNWALCGAYETFRKKNTESSGHIITTAIEHHAILHTAQYLESLGVSVTYLKPDHEGLITAAQVTEAIRPDTFLVSVMTANNEIGTIEPVCEIADAVRGIRKDILIHTDAVQAFGQINLQGIAKHADLLSASSHKLGGPKGVGILFIRDGIKFSPFMRGGMQESGRRAGTENVAGIAGFGEACKLAFAGIDSKISAEILLRDRLIAKLSDITDVIINGPYNAGDYLKRLPGNVSVCIKGIEGESALIMLDREGICASAGSACATGAMEPSHVLKAIGRSDDEAKGSLRFTLSHHNTMEEIDKAAGIIAEIVEKLRNGKNF
ncbi:MAG: cysteine desulfurase [Lachnospiraceae bacterium]|nr:cysteine desulfurase [Lachnospiraceae bacterium]